MTYSIVEWLLVFVSQASCKIVTDLLPSRVEKMSLEPDRPVPFGYKIAWLALKTSDSKGLARELDLRVVRVTNWEEGIREAYQSKSLIFIAPPLAGWTLAIGSSLGPPNETAAFVKPLLEALSRRFGDAQYFCTHRVVELHVWARALDGQLIRGYAYIGESGQTLWNEGEQSREEAALGFTFFNSFSAEVDQEDYWAHEGLKYPDEDCVIRIAASWSLEPTTLDEQFQESGLGLLGELPVLGRKE